MPDRIFMMLKKKFQVVPHQVQVDIIGCGGGTSPKVAVIRTDQGSYLFNCGEDTQRLLTSNGIASRRKGIQNIFITQNSWENTGGLLGYVLLEELEEVKTREILTVHGPNSIDSKLTENVQVSRGCQRFERRQLSQGHYEDYICRIDHVILKKDNNATQEKRENLFTHDQKDSGGIQNTDDTVSDLENDLDIAVAYIMKLKPRPPKIDIEKCKQLGVPKGPMIGKLSRNEKVILENGQEILPEDVLVDRIETDKKIVVLDCPSEEFIDSMLKAEEFTLCQCPQENIGEQVEVIVHMSPLEILRNERYQNFITKFGRDTSHIVLHEDTCPFTYQSMYEYTAKMNLICPKIFPRLLPGIESKSWEYNCDINLIQGHPEMAYHIRGKTGLDQSMCVACDYDRFAEDVKTNFPLLSSQLKETYIDTENTINGNDQGIKYPEVVFLGTTSACPATYRNVSCILVHTSSSSAVLLDCGGGSSTQLFQFYGTAFDHTLVKIKAVFVSHFHADHNSGLVGFIKRRRKAFKILQKEYEPLWLALPNNYWHWWLRIYNERDPIMNLCRKIPLKDLNTFEPEVSQQFLQDIDVAKFEPVPVLHCRDAYGLSITLSDGTKLVYSGDTMPCDALVDAGQDCDLLIHECTFEDYLADYAKDKKHSTQSQAIHVGERMRAKFIILTHFSARYQPYYHLKDAPDHVFAAFDFMRVNMEDLPLLKHVRKILPFAFKEEIEDLSKKERKFKNRKDNSKTIYKGNKDKNVQSQSQLGKRKNVQLEMDSKRSKGIQNPERTENG